MNANIRYKENKKMLRAIYFKYFVSYLCPSLRLCLHILTEIEIMMPSLVGYRFLDVPINSWERLSLIITMRNTPYNDFPMLLSNSKNIPV